MLPQFNRQALWQACGRDDLIQKAIAQIIKDFAEFGFEISFSGDVYGFYDELFGQMRTHVKHIMGEHYSQFLNFLYRIDVSEGQVTVYQREMGGVDYEDALTELIIHREMKKVMIREYFKAQTKASGSENSALLE